jgi:hypothetical protein
MTLRDDRVRSRSATVRTTERDSMFYVVLVIIAAVLVGALYFVRGRSSRA